MPIGIMSAMPNLGIDRLCALDKKKTYVIRVKLYNKSVKPNELEDYIKNLKKVFKKFRLKVVIMVTQPGMDAWVEEK